MPRRRFDTHTRRLAIPMIALLAVVSIAQAQDGGPRRDTSPRAGPDAGARVDRAVDAGARDALRRDGGSPAGRDAGPRDAGVRGPRDAGPRDAGPRDAGPRDAGPRDAGPRDAGPRDAGPSPVARDAGVLGVGLAGSSDAGSSARDAGSIEGGIPGRDAGSDVGTLIAETSPAVGGSAEPAPPATATATEGGHVIKTLLGLIALLALAWIGAHPRVQRLEERLGISQVVTSGLPFVVLGLIARAPGVDILTDEVLIALTPLLQFGLGWIGFHTGFQFEGAAMDEVPKGTSSVVILLTGASFAMIALACGIVLWATGLGPSLSTLARDAAIVGLAGALSAPTLDRISGRRIGARAAELARTVGVLDDVVGVVALAMLFAWLHPRGGGWALPGVGWLFVTFGMAATLGLVMYAVLRATDSPAESMALLLGSVCFTSGMAGFFSLPPLVVCFLAGMLLKNLPGGDKPRLAASFARLERPIYLVFLVVVGALWQIGDWRGWVLLPVFVIARVVGRLLGARVARRLPSDSRHPGLDEMDDPDLVTPPMGALALAFVVTARTLYESPGIQAIVTAVLGGAVATEIIVQVAARRTGRRSPVPAPPRSGETAIDRASWTPVPPAPAAPERPASDAEISIEIDLDE